MASSIWGLAKTNPQPVADSAVDFPTRTRFHIALNVRQVEPMIPFYRVLFGAPPHTVREGYAKFDLREPPLNFSLNEVPKNARGNGCFGVEVKDSQLIEDMVARLQDAGLAWAHTSNSAAHSPELQIRDPEGNAWRIYTIRRAVAAGSTQ
jgi:catechol-2,3-dioxygenase